MSVVQLVEQMQPWQLAEREGLDGLILTWSVARTGLTGLINRVISEPSTTQQLSLVIAPAVRSAILDLSLQGFQSFLIEWFNDHLLRQFLVTGVPRLWCTLSQNEEYQSGLTSKGGVEVNKMRPHMLDFVTSCFLMLTNMRAATLTLYPTLQMEPQDSNLCPYFNAYLFNESLKETPVLFKDLISKLFKCYRLEAADADDDMELEQGEKPTETDMLSTKEVASMLQYLQWIELFEGTFAEMLHEEIDAEVLASCAEQFDVSGVDTVMETMQASVMPWVEQVLRSGTASNHKETETDISLRISQWNTRLQFHVFESLASLRIKEIFEIITDFPDSLEAVMDLKKCLDHTCRQRELIDSLRDTLTRRLLHPGANTSQIIDVYVSMIKSLRILDPTGVILQAVAEPVKEYLREREDTVRCIVTNLTDEGSGDLYEELGRPDVREIEHEADSDDEEDGPGVNWTPEPREADPRQSSKSRRTDDILSMLVSIYGSKELFVTEYRLMLADKLLANISYDTDKEVRTLELLKLRFGEESLQSCEVMVKDVDESKRINANLHSSLRSTGGASAETVLIDATIISGQFWPPLQGDELTLHPEIEKRLTTFSDRYAVLKNPRLLQWKPRLGLVQVELDFNGDSREYSVSPFLATVIMHFGDRDSWTATDLSDVLSVPESSLRKKLSYWLNLGVIKEENIGGEVYYRGIKSLEECHPRSGNGAHEEASEAAASAEAKKEEDMKVYESFILGMLTNFESLPIDRIHNMLTMFVNSGEHKYEKSITELSSFLQRMVLDDKLECMGTLYARRKK